MFVHQLDTRRYLVYCPQRKGYYIDTLLGHGTNGAIVEEAFLENANEPSETRFSELIALFS